MAPSRACTSANATHNTASPGGMGAGEYTACAGGCVPHRLLLLLWRNAERRSARCHGHHSASARHPSPSHGATHRVGHLHVEELGA